MSHLVPPGAHDGVLHTSVGALRVLRGGADSAPSAVPVVLVHGGGTDNSGISWFRLLAPLAEHRRVFAVDLPGFGGSMVVAPVGGPDAMADLLADAMNNDGLDSAVIIGVSMGGDVALTLALRHPNRVRGLVLIGSGGLTDRVGRAVTHWSAWVGTRTPDWILRPAAALANRFVDTAMKAMVHDISTLPPEVRSEFAREARVPGAGMAYGRYNQATITRKGMTNDHRAELHRITVPTLLVHGANDPLVDPTGSEEAARLLPDARLVLLDNCGHWAQLEAHDRFLAELGPFLDAIDD